MQITDKKRWLRSERFIARQQRERRVVHGMSIFHIQFQFQGSAIDLLFYAIQAMVRGVMLMVRYMFSVSRKLLLFTATPFPS